MRLVLPLPPNLANKAFGHWAKKHRARRAYGLRCWAWYGDAGHEPKRPQQPFKRARIAAKLYTWAPMDADNLEARLKWTQDWLVEAGFIVDDSPAVLEWYGRAEQEVDRKNRRVEITLEQIT